MSPNTEVAALFFRYHFTFDQQHEVTFEARLDPKTLDYLPASTRTPPNWTSFEYHQSCEDCIYREDLVHCPIAVNVGDMVEAFKDIYSYETVDVKVETRDRVYSKNGISVQQGLGSLLGIIMVTSGCVELDKLRPMVRFHLPFASLKETIYRAASMYLLAQYFRRKGGLEPDWDLVELIRIYHKINTININLCQRLQAISEKDASLNAVVVLDTFTHMLPYSIEETLSDLEYLFASYLK